MAKDFMNNIELQAVKKEKTILQSKVNQFETENSELREQLERLISSDNGNGKNYEVNKIKISDIKLKDNIRDRYEFEEIEHLALDIALNGQLQPVLLTNDNYLLAGYRRYYAVSLLNEKPELFNEVKKVDFLVGYKLEKNNQEITEQELKDLQFAENNERRSIDNFQLSKLYAYYLENGFSQKDLADKFKKSKGFISGIVSINNIDETLVNFLKEFQIFGWSKKKFAAANLNVMNENDLYFYNENKGIIGWRPLYEIAKQTDIAEQKKMFLKLYKNRLNEEELNSEYFKGAIPSQRKEENSLLQQTLKYTDKIKKHIEEIYDNGSKQSEEYLQIKEKISDLENLLKNSRVSENS